MFAGRQLLAQGEAGAVEGEGSAASCEITLPLRSSTVRRPPVSRTRSAAVVKPSAVGWTVTLDLRTAAGTAQLASSGKRPFGAIRTRTI
jgi:hypothetical protein